MALAAGRRMTPRNCAVPTPLLSAATSAADMTFCSHRACGHDILLRRQDSDAKFPVKFKLAGVAQTGSGLPKGPTKGGQGSWTLPVTYPDCRTLTQAAETPSGNKVAAGARCRAAAASPSSCESNRAQRSPSPASSPFAHTLSRRCEARPRREALERRHAKSCEGPCCQRSRTA